MRRDPTLGERILWSELRNSQLEARFRRQEVIGNSIVDFACWSRRLVIEVDGDTHDDPGRDARRESELVRRGWRVLRFWDDELIDNREEVLESIWDAVHPE